MRSTKDLVGEYRRVLTACPDRSRVGDLRAWQPDRNSGNGTALQGRVAATKFLVDRWVEWIEGLWTAMSTTLISEGRMRF